MSINDKYANRPGGVEPLFPNALVRMGMVTAAALFVFAVAVFYLSSIFIGVEEPANPAVTPDNVKPEWYFLAFYQSLKFFSKDCIDVERFLRIISNPFAEVLAPGIGLTLIFLLPFWERTKPKPMRKRPVFLAIVTLGVLAYIGLTIWGKLS